MLVLPLDSLKIPLSKFKGLSKVLIMVYSRLILNANFGNSSDFKEMLLENNMINYFNASRNIYDDYLVVTFTYESEVYQAVKEAVLNKIKKLEIDDSYLKRTIRSNIANLILLFENMEQVSSSIQDDIILYDNIVDDIYDIFNNVKLTELNKLTKIFNTDNISSTIVIPKQLS